jgi:ferric-dicitrate binding protein FerR (iron transport regulator)
MSGRRLGEYVEPPIDGARLDRQWHGVVRSLRRGRARWLASWALGAAAIAAAIALAQVPRGPMPGDRLIAEGVPIEATLFDGTRITIERGTLDVAVADERAIELVLVGAAAFDVPSLVGRRFVVRAGDVEVHVDQALLHVATTPLEVQVTEGKATDVRRGGATVARVLEGETWRESVSASAAP